MNRMLLEGWEYPVAWEKVVGVGDLETEVGLGVAVVQGWAGPEVGEAVVTGDRRSRSHNGSRIRRCGSGRKRELGGATKRGEEREKAPRLFF